MPKVDHVVIACRDLLKASDRLFDRFGLASVAGGRHERWGTANRLVPIGAQYLELLAADEPVAANPLAQVVHASSATGDRLMAVCCEVDDIAEVAERLGTNLVPGQRRLPDGREVTWTLTALDAALSQGLPFFITWRSGRDIRLGNEQATHASEPTQIARVDVGGDEAALEEWLGGPCADIRGVGGAPGVREVTLATTSGDLTLTF